VTDAQRVAERVVAGMLRHDEFSRWLGLEVTALAPGSCSCRMTVRREMVNGFGFAHGGIVFSLADSALAFASNTGGKVNVSIDNTISYPAAIHGGDVLTAACAEESRTNRLGFYRVTVTNQRGDTVALFRGTVYQTGQDHRTDG
jgi:acyl-CoA thioesterase